MPLLLRVRSSPVWGGVVIIYGHAVTSHYHGTAVTVPHQSSRMLSAAAAMAALLVHEPHGLRAVGRGTLPVVYSSIGRRAHRLPAHLPTRITRYLKGSLTIGVAFLTIGRNCY